MLIGTNPNRHRNFAPSIGASLAEIEGPGICVGSAGKIHNCGLPERLRTCVGAVGSRGRALDGMTHFAKCAEQEGGLEKEALSIIIRAWPY